MYTGFAGVLNSEIPAKKEAREATWGLQARCRVGTDPAALSSKGTIDESLGREIPERST